MSSGQSDTRRRLGLADQALMAVDRGLRGLGFPGFDTQMLVWSSGRVEAGVLRPALERLNVHDPVVTSRLDRSGGGPCWRFRPGAACPLHETDLTSADPQAVWDRAAELLAAPCDPAKADPIRFHLLHRPDAGDVFLMQYNHTLMDNNAAVRVLGQIDGLARGGADFRPPVSLEGQDLARRHLRRFPRERRMDAALRTRELWRDVLRERILMLGGRRPSGTGPPPLRIAARRLQPEEVRGLRARAVRVCGYPALSMAVLAGVFRAIGRLAPQQGPAGAGLTAGIGLDLGLRTDAGPIFQNLTSLAPIAARVADLADREGLLRMLGRQMRERLEGGADLGMLQLAALFNRRPRQARIVIQHLLLFGFSLWYAYFGSADAAGASFCGAAVEDVCYAGPAWAPPGLTLLANQFRGRLLLQATYVPDSVPEPLAREFLDAVVADLIA